VSSKNDSRPHFEETIVNHSNADITLPAWFVPAAVVCGLMFVVSPVLIANTPYEATMGLVQKIFYYHLPSAFMFLLWRDSCAALPVRAIWRRAIRTTTALRGRRPN
jgi:hypothetical protein